MITFLEIQQIICDGQKIMPQILQSKTRKREIVFTKQLIMYFTRCKTKESLSHIGKHFKSEKSRSGYSDHATVIHACKVIHNLTWSDFDIALKVESYEKQIKKLEKTKSERIIKEKARLIPHLIRMITNGCPIRRETVVIYNKLIEK